MHRNFSNDALYVFPQKFIQIEKIFHRDADLTYKPLPKHDTKKESENLNLRMTST